MFVLVWYTHSLKKRGGGKKKKTLDNKQPAHVKFGSLFLLPSGETEEGGRNLTIPLFHRGRRVCLSVVRDVLECTRMHAMSL